MEPQNNHSKPVIVLRCGAVTGVSSLVQRAGQLRHAACALALTASLTIHSKAAVITNLFAPPAASPSLVDTGPSLLRVLGALALVLGLFLGGAWMVRNGRFSALGRNRSARLNVLETRSLGARQAIYVVGYRQERFLIGSTPAGINLLSHLAPASDEENNAPVHDGSNLSFGQALAHVLRGQKNVTPKSPGRT